MKNFTYYRPKTAGEAVALLEKTWGKAELLAGGTDLLDLQKEYVAQPDKVISLSGLSSEEFNDVFVKEEGGGQTFSIGAGVKLARIAGSKVLANACTAVTDAASIVGGPQIRNMGTLGGNLCQRNRCWYFRDEHVNCLLKTGDKCFALDGENRYHAIFTRGHNCIIVSPSTLAPGLIALGASANVMGADGKRKEIELSKFFRAPAGNGDRETVLAPNEMVLSVKVTSKSGQKSASYEVRHKQSHDWPLVQAAVAFVKDGDKVKDVKIVLGHVAPTPIVSDEAAAKVEGKAITEETAAAAGEAAIEKAKGLNQNAYKLKLVVVAVKRALLTAAGAKKYWEA